MSRVLIELASHWCNRGNRSLLRGESGQSQSSCCFSTANQSSLQQSRQNPLASAYSFNYRGSPRAVPQHILPIPALLTPSLIWSHFGPAATYCAHFRPNTSRPFLLTCSFSQLFITACEERGPANVRPKISGLTWQLEVVCLKTSLNALLLLLTRPEMR